MDGYRIERWSVEQYMDDVHTQIIPVSYTHLDVYKRQDMITPHMLRHWCGSHLYEDTKNIKLVQRVLRHKNIAVTAENYVHVSDDEVDSAVKMLRTDRQNVGQCNQSNQQQFTGLM